MNLYSDFEKGTPAVVLAEGAFGTASGKTTHGILMHGELFDTRAVVDSTRAGQTAADVLGRDDVPDVPIVDTVKRALERVPEAEALIIGVAPAGGELPEAWVDDIQYAMQSGCDVVSGLHLFLGDREEWADLAAECGAKLFDVRKPPAESELRVADGRVDDVDADVVATVGTDCAVGKRTTTVELYHAAREAGLDAGWVATGQTGIMIGAQRGVVIDRVPADFTAGTVEDLVCGVAADHDLVFVEGQASLTHRAYSGVTTSILHGAQPDAVVLADDPDRETRAHFDRFSVAGVESERRIINAVSDASIAALSTWGDPETEAAKYGLPAANTYHDNGPEDLLEAVREAL
jgi:uncharacterized NAD-dependent epimerase/dehydratase family protein